LLGFAGSVERLVKQAVSRGHRVIHISSHSFTAELDGRVRGADVGLLYHPGRRGEAEVCARWKESLAESAPELRVRRNYPNAGKGDGLTSHLRQRFMPPGQPWRNGYVESFNSRVRDECLNINAFWSPTQARVVISDWKYDYNHDRRHSALGYLPPAPYAASCTHQ
jgi:integrase-like protein